MDFKTCGFFCTLELGCVCTNLLTYLRNLFSYVLWSEFIDLLFSPINSKVQNVLLPHSCPRIPLDRKSNKPAGTLLAVTDTKMAQTSLWRMVTCVMPSNLHATFLWEIHKHSFRLMITIENFILSIHLFLFYFFPNSALRVFEFIPLSFNINAYLWSLEIQI